MSDMPTYLSEPILAQFAAGIEQDDEAAFMACADWLGEHEATTSDLLNWYAGQPTHWLARTHTEDSNRRLVLAAWLKHVEPERRVLATNNRSMVRVMPRWEAVKTVGVFGEQRLKLLARAAYNDGPSMWCQKHMTPNCFSCATQEVVDYLQRGFMGGYLGGVEVSVLDAERLNLKRLVLNLFPDAQRRIDVECEHELLTAKNEVYYRDYLVSQGFRTDLPYKVRDQNAVYKRLSQTLAAPDWIPKPDAELPVAAGRHWRGSSQERVRPGD